MADGPDVDARDLHTLLLTTQDFEGFLTELVRLAAATIDGYVSVGLTLARDGRPATVANSDDAAAKYDEVQYGTGHGPCLHAMRTGQVVVVDDLAHDDRWGEYGPHVLGLGVRSSLSLPVNGGKDAVGALNLYSGQPGTFGQHEQQQGQQFAAETSRALALALRLARHADQVSHLRAALTSRTVIDQALGIIMAQSRCDAERAFEILRAASQHRNVKLRQVAADIVTAVSNAPPMKTPFKD